MILNFKKPILFNSLQSDELQTDLQQEQNKTVKVNIKIDYIFFFVNQILSIVFYKYTAESFRRLLTLFFE